MIGRDQVRDQASLTCSDGSVTGLNVTPRTPANALRTQQVTGQRRRLDSCLDLVTDPVNPLLGHLGKDMRTGHREEHDVLGCAEALAHALSIVVAPEVPCGGCALTEQLVEVGVVGAVSIGEGANVDDPDLQFPEGPTHSRLEDRTAVAVTHSSLDIVLMALALLETSFAARDIDEALLAVRADLEVLDRETLVRVAAAIAAQATWTAPYPSVRQRLRSRVQRLRVVLMVGPL